MADLVDPTVNGKYPVILSKNLLGGEQTEIFTGVQYNHKPTLSSGSAPESARLKPSVQGQTSSYDLTFKDDEGFYGYSGARKFNGDQYVLYFDPAQKAFILDRVESTFDMNLTRTPTNSDPEALGRKHPHIGGESKAKAESAKKTTNTEERKEKGKSLATSPFVKPRATSPLVKPQKKKADAPTSSRSKQLELPKTEPKTTEDKSKAKPRKQMDDDDDEEDDDDGGLLVEYPGAKPNDKRDFSPAFPSVRRFDEFMDRRESEADDADGESDDEPGDEFKLPSPMNNRTEPAQTQDEPERDEPRSPSVHEDEPMAADEGEAEDDMDDFERDLEKDMEKAFEGLNNQDEDESEISEED